MKLNSWDMEWIAVARAFAREDMRDVLEALAESRAGRLFLMRSQKMIGVVSQKLRRRDVVAEITDYPSEPERGRMNWQ